MDKVDLSVVIIWTISVLAIIALTGFLCWHFNSGWYVLVLAFMPSMRHKTEEGKEDEQRD